MIEVEESINIMNWLIANGIDIHEAAKAVRDVELGDSMAESILKLFKRREIYKEEKEDWGNPITP